MIYFTEMSYSNIKKENSLTMGTDATSHLLNFYLSFSYVTKSKYNPCAGAVIPASVRSQPASMDSTSFG